MSEDRKSWLDSWTKKRRYDQQDLARRWATRNDPEPIPEPVPEPSAPIPSPLEEMRAYVRSTRLRPMRKDEEPPLEFADPNQQAAFEAYARKYWWILRVPDEVDLTSRTST